MPFKTRYPLLTLTLVLLCAGASDLKKQPGKNGGTEYKDEDLGISFTLAPGWTAEEPRRWTDMGEDATTIRFGDPENQAFTGLYYRKFKNAEPLSPQAIDRALAEDLKAKISQRTREGLTDYHVQPKSEQSRVIGGQRALSCVADYSDHGQNMVEYLVWIQSAHTIAEFYGRTSADGASDLRKRFDPIVETLRLP